MYLKLVLVGLVLVSCNFFGSEEPSSESSSNDKDSNPNDSIQVEDQAKGFWAYGDWTSISDSIYQNTDYRCIYGLGPNEGTVDMRCLYETSSGDTSSILGARFTPNNMGSFDQVMFIEWWSGVRDTIQVLSYITTSAGIRKIDSSYTIPENPDEIQFKTNEFDISTQKPYHNGDSTTQDVVLLEWDDYLAPGLPQKGTIRIPHLDSTKITQYTYETDYPEKALFPESNYKVTPCVYQGSSNENWCLLKVSAQGEHLFKITPNGNDEITGYTKNYMSEHSALWGGLIYYDVNGNPIASSWNVQREDQWVNIDSLETNNIRLSPPLGEFVYPEE